MKSSVLRELPSAVDRLGQIGEQPRHLGRAPLICRSRLAARSRPRCRAFFDCRKHVSTSCSSLVLGPRKPAPPASPRPATQAAARDPAAPALRCSSSRRPCRCSSTRTRPSKRSTPAARESPEPHPVPKSPRQRAPEPTAPPRRRSSRGAPPRARPPARASPPFRPSGFPSAPAVIRAAEVLCSPSGSRRGG